MTENRTKEEIPVSVKEKTCGKCKRTLPASDFWKARSSKDGLQPQCKDCQMGAEQGTYTGKKDKKPAKAEKPKKEAKPKKVKEPKAT
jgi:RNase P subunit RPR2